MVKNLPAKAGDTGLIPDPGRSHMEELLRPSATTIEPVLQSLGAPTTEPMCSNYWNPHTQSLCSAARETTTLRSYCKEKSVHCNQRVAPSSPQIEESPGSNKDRTQPPTQKSISSDKDGIKNKKTLPDMMLSSVPGTKKWPSTTAVGSEIKSQSRSPLSGSSKEWLSWTLLCLFWALP